MDFNAPLPSQPGSGLVMSIGGVLPVKNLAQLHAEEKAQAQIANNRSYITNLAGYVKSRWGCPDQAARRLGDLPDVVLEQGACRVELDS